MRKEKAKCHSTIKGPFFIKNKKKCPYIIKMSFLCNRKPVVFFLIPGQTTLGCIRLKIVFDYTFPVKTLCQIKLALQDG